MTTTTNKQQQTDNNINNNKMFNSIKGVEYTAINF